MSLFKRESEIERLTRRKKELVLERDKKLRDMRNRNSKRETKITILENASQTDYENTQKIVEQLNIEIEKAVKNIDTELTYVNQIAEKEKLEYQNTKNEEIEKKEKQKKNFKGDLLNE